MPRAAVAGVGDPVPGSYRGTAREGAHHEPGTVLVAALIQHLGDANRALPVLPGPAQAVSLGGEIELRGAVRHPLREAGAPGALLAEAKGEPAEAVAPHRRDARRSGDALDRGGHGHGAESGMAASGELGMRPYLTQIRR